MNRRTLRQLLFLLMMGMMTLVKCQSTPTTTTSTKLNISLPTPNATKTANITVTPTSTQLPETTIGGENSGEQTRNVLFIVGGTVMGAGVVFAGMIFALRQSRQLKQRQREVRWTWGDVVERSARRF